MNLNMLLQCLPELYIFNKMIFCGSNYFEKSVEAYFRDNVQGKVSAWGAVEWY